MELAGRRSGTHNRWDRYDDWFWMPGRRPSGRLIGLPLPPLAEPPTCVEWFGGWVEQCQVDLVPLHPSFARAWWSWFRNR